MGLLHVEEADKNRHTRIHPTAILVTPPQTGIDAHSVLTRVTTLSAGNPFPSELESAMPWISLIQSNSQVGRLGKGDGGSNEPEVTTRGPRGSFYC